MKSIAFKIPLTILWLIELMRLIKDLSCMVRNVMLTLRRPLFVTLSLTDQPGITCKNILAVLLQPFGKPLSLPAHHDGLPAGDWTLIAIFAS